MTSERSKRRDFLSLIFIAKSISKKLLIIIIYYYYYKSLLMGVWDQVTGAERAPESLESLLAGYLNYNTPLEFFNSLRQKASAEKRRL